MDRFWAPELAKQAFLLGGQYWRLEMPFAAAHESVRGTNRLLEAGQSMSALPGHFRINLFRYCQGVIDLDAEIPDRAFDLGT